MKLSTSILSSLFFAALACADGEFNVLSFNVAGLPEILQSNGESLDKTTATTQIGKKFSELRDQLDVIHVQEDFNYHATLYKYDDHPYRTATSGGVPFGSGLNTLSNYNWVDFSRTKWNKCSDASESDCLTPKGFTHMRMELESGVYISMINLHADAGTEDGDETARDSNIQQVADYIDSWATDEAVIVFGDTNSRYTRTDDNISVFSSQNGLTDAWVKLIRNGVAPSKGADAIMCSNPSTTNNCEVVDKVFYRSSKFVTLDATAFNYVGSDFEYDNDTLSDHNPILVNFTYTVSDDFRTSELTGGNYGDAFFNDINSLTDGSHPTKLSFRGAKRLDNVGLTLSSGTVLSHGGSGGDLSELTLADGEYWTKATLCTGAKSGTLRNFYISATTSKGNALSAGSKTSDCTSYEAPSGYQIGGFYGQSGDNVDQLGFIYIKT